MNCIASNFMYVTVNIFSTFHNILKVHSTSMLILLTITVTTLDCIFIYDFVLTIKVRADIGLAWLGKAGIDQAYSGSPRLAPAHLGLPC